MIVRPSKMRLGLSLTELLILMSMSTLIMSMSTILLYRAMRCEIDSRAFADAERTALRLGRAFRSDVLQATAAVTDASKLKPNVFLQLRMSNDESIEYRRTDGNILRIVSRGGKIVQREEFALQLLCKLAVREDPSPTRIVLTISSPALDTNLAASAQLKAYRAVPVAMQFEATLNRGATGMSTSNEQRQPGE